MRPVQLERQLRGDAARTQFGRALAELGIEWIAAHSPQAKGRIERLFGVLQDRLAPRLRVTNALCSNVILLMRRLQSTENNIGSGFWNGCERHCAYSRAVSAIVYDTSSGAWLAPHSS